MRECTNPAMKDRLPELLRARGGDEAVRAHAADCESCARELALLRQVHAAAVTPTLDAARIAAAVSPYRASGRPWGRVWASPALRVAAVLLLVAGGATLLSRTPDVAVRDTALTRVALQESARAASPVTPAVMPPTARAAAPELAVGDPLSDLSESDLRAFLSEMKAIEAVTSTETDVIVLPAVGQSGA
jgi:hypothetical protein